MRSLSSKLSQVTMAALMAGVVVCSAAVAAEQIPEITIQGSRLVRTKEPARQPGLLPSEVIELSKTVAYSDLDVSTVSGAKELDKRIATTARSLCDELDRLTMMRDPDCVKYTVGGSKKQIDLATRLAEQVRAAAR